MHDGKVFLHLSVNSLFLGQWKYIMLILKLKIYNKCTPCYTHMLACVCARTEYIVKFYNYMPYAMHCQQVAF